MLERKYGVHSHANRKQYRENHCKIDGLIGKIKSSLIQESIALCFNLIMV